MNGFGEEVKMNEYWHDVLGHRMPIQDELWRLEMVLKAHLYEHNEFDAENKMTPLEFLNTKRPYGNKNIAASIVYTLGWDYKRVLCYEFLPEEVKNEALTLHEMLKTKLQNE